MVTLTAILTDPVALRTGYSRIITAAVPLAVLGITWLLVWWRLMPTWPLRRRRKEKKADD